MAQTSLQQVASGFSSPVGLFHAPGETDRAFTIEQSGRIRTLDLSTGATSTYMNITGLQTGGERGLLGLAFDPDFSNNGHFYVNVTDNGRTEIRRYTATGDPATSTSASTATAQAVLQFSQPFSNHNGGWIGFNPQINPGEPQYLHIATGDGGSGGDPQNNSQDITNNLLGKILRIDPSGDDFPASGTANYAIPADNPFVGTTGDDEIWSYGLRNPWRNSFDRNTGDLWIADVGQNVLEEINFQPASSAGGENYGWRVREGTECFDDTQTGGNPGCFSLDLVDPVYEYQHNFGNFGGLSVTGGYVYEGEADRFDGQYFFADFVTENIWTIDPHAQDPASTVLNRNGILPESTSSLNGISAFGEDGNGEMYILSHSNGRIYRVETDSEIALWNGDTATGTAGDGTSWTQANNWTRGTATDSGFVTQDTVVMLPGSSATNVNLGGNVTVSALEFQGNYRLQGGSITALSGNIAVAAGITAAIDGDLSAETANHSIRKRGAGRLLVNGAAGQVVVFDGTFGGNGIASYLTSYDSGNVAPGDGIGTLSVTNNYVQPSAASLEIEIANDGSGTMHDVLAVGGTADIAGELNILTAGQYSLARGTIDEIELLTATAVLGEFDAITLDGAPLEFDPSLADQSHAGDGLFQSVEYASTDVTLRNYFALPGDANGDGFVDVSDFNIWSENRFTSGTDWITGDFNGDGLTDGSDFNIWNENKFTSVTQQVPEPTSGLMLLLGLAGLTISRRRNR